MTKLQTQYQENLKRIKDHISSLKRNSFRKKLEVEVSYLVDRISKYDISYSPDALEYVVYEIDKLGSLVKK